PALANNPCSLLRRPPLSPPTSIHAAGSSETKSESRRTPQSNPSARDKAKQRPRPALRCMHLQRTERSRPAPPASNAAHPAFPPHPKNLHNPCPYSPRSSIRRDASRANVSETPPPRLAHSLRTAKAPRRFLLPFASTFAAAPWTRGSCSRLRQFQLFRKFRILVVTVQRIASRRQTLPRCRRAIAERPANALVLDGFPRARIAENLRIRQNHSSHPHAVRPSCAHRRLRHIRQKILQVTVRSADKNQIRKTLFQLARHIHLSRHSNQRILRRLISIRRWI